MPKHVNMSIFVIRVAIYDHLPPLCIQLSNVHVVGIIDTPLAQPSLPLSFAGVPHPKGVEEEAIDFRIFTYHIP